MLAKLPAILCANTNGPGGKVRAVCLHPRHERLNPVATGPLPENLPHELEALRLKLIELDGTDLAPEETEALAVQISAIRLQLKRLAADQAALWNELSQRAIEHQQRAASTLFPELPPPSLSRSLARENLKQPGILG